MSSFFRLDRTPLAAPVKATIYEGRVARVHAPGDALMYSSGPEHRDADELAKIVEQLPGIKVYLGHPDTFPADKSGQKVVGYVEAGRLDDDSAVARVVITDEETLAAIHAGTHELSLGYQCVLDGKRYQRNIVLDHLAVVERARCGAACTLRTDEGEMMKIEIGASEELKQVLDSAVKEIKDTMAAAGFCAECKKPKAECKCGEHVDSATCTCKNHTIVHNNGESMVTQEEFDALKAKLDEATTANAKLEVEATNARKDAEVLASKLENAEKAIEAAKAEAAEQVAKAKADADEAIASEIQARVDARVSLVTEAGKVLKDVELAKLSDREIKCAVIKHVDGDDVPAEKSMDYVTGVYEGALKRAANASASRETVRAAITEMRKDNAPLTGVDAEKAAREKMLRESSTAWANK